MPRSSLTRFALLAICCCLLAPCRAVHAADAQPPRLSVPASSGPDPLVLVVYGDTRFTQRTGVVNSAARQALVERISGENPAAIMIGGDLVYEGSGSGPSDYQTFRNETRAWSNAHIPVFPALGNHEFKGCAEDVSDCLENWWDAFPELALRPYRWYSVAIGSNLLALVLDSDAPLKSGSEQRVWFEQQLAGADPRVKFILILLHYPPVRDPIFPHMRDEQEIARYLSRHARSLPQQVLVVGSHIHNYERYSRDGIIYVVSGGGGAKPVPAPRMFGEQSHLRTGVNFHYLRLTLRSDSLSVSMVRYEAGKPDSGAAWTEPDRFEIRAKD